MEPTDAIAYADALSKSSSRARTLAKTDREGFNGLAGYLHESKFTADEGKDVVKDSNYTPNQLVEMLPVLGRELDWGPACVANYFVSDRRISNGLKDIGAAMVFGLSHAASRGFALGSGHSLYTETAWQNTSYTLAALGAAYVVSGLARLLLPGGIFNGRNVRKGNQFLSDFNQTKFRLSQGGHQNAA